MALATYDLTFNMARQLAVSEQLRLLENLTKAVRHRLSSKPKEELTYSIMELEGLGAEIWQDVDAQEYVNQERASWAS